MPAPAFSQHAQLLHRVEEFQVEELIAEFRVEAFAAAVFPRRPGFDVQRPCACIRNPFAQVFGDELRTLSERMCSGTPFRTMTSARAPITLAEDQRRSARISRHSRVYSSIRFRMRTLLPSCVRALSRAGIRTRRQQCRTALMLDPTCRSTLRWKAASFVDGR